MVFLFGSPYLAAALPLAVMLPLLPLRFVNNGLGTALSALDRQNDRTRAVFFAALFNLWTNLYAIPRWGAVGAAATTLLTEVLLSVWLTVRLLPWVRGFRVGGPLLRTVAPAIPMAVLVLAVPGWHVLARVAFGAVVYVVGGRLTSAWRPDDLTRLRRI